MYCSSCGKESNPGAAFCAGCGMPMPKATQSVGAPTSTPGTGSGLGVASLVLGVLALLPFSILAGIPAIITGHTAVRQKRRGKGMAVAGLVMGWFSVAVVVPLVLIASAMLVTKPKMADPPPLKPTRFARQMESRFEKFDKMVADAQTAFPDVPAGQWHTISDEVAHGRQVMAEMPGLTDQKTLKAKRDTVLKAYLAARKVLKDITGKGEPAVDE